ncbi:unnamed protein product [Durusdinium trenchii]|uniref:Uncharacterized protein n=1 Tax=Durusdinium trenchii TaxID=1381693 RepID=A0ABP0KV46_9DINO
MEELQRHLREASGSLEKVQSTQAKHSLVLEELHSLILDLKALAESKQNGHFMEIPIPKDPPLLPGLLDEPLGPAVQKNPKGKRRTAATLSKVSEELTELGEGRCAASARPKVEVESRVIQRNRNPHASTLLGLFTSPRSRTPTVSMDDLEAQTARDLLSSHTRELPTVPVFHEENEDVNDTSEPILNFDSQDPVHFRGVVAGSCASQGLGQLQKSQSAVEFSNANGVDAQPPKVKTMSRMGSMERQEILGDNPRHLDLDELQDKHDAKARSLANSNTASKGFAETHSTALDFYSPMPCTARVFLHLMGILSPQTWPFVLLRIWIFSLLVGVGALIGLIIWQSSGKEFYDTITTITTTCYLLGVMSGAWSLRRVKIQELLGSNIGSLELYAHQHGFLAEWHFMSSKRLLETSGFLMLMLATRWLVHFDLFEQQEEPFERTCGFCFAAVGMAALAYLQLHLVAGLDLAIDSFTVNFFRNMDLGIASAEWNVVQVTLRQVSTKLGASLLLLGSSCLVSLLLLVEIAFFRPEEQRGELTNVQLILFIAWLVPPLLLFLYVLMRAANITEKAMRVAPLVNSWSFKRGEGSSGWMDVGRQYMVQYIRQSEAGFYFQGRRLYIFQITKLCYYLGAFSMAVLSSIS